MSKRQALVLFKITQDLMLKIKTLDLGISLDFFFHSILQSMSIVKYVFLALFYKIFIIGNTMPRIYFSTSVYFSYVFSDKTKT